MGRMRVQFPIEKHEEDADIRLDKKLKQERRDRSRERSKVISKLNHPTEPQKQPEKKIDYFHPLLIISFFLLVYAFFTVLFIIR